MNPRPDDIIPGQTRLRMTSIEKFHLYNDTPEHPNLIFGRLRIAGRLERAVAQQAWQLACQRQPFSNVRADLERGDHDWILASQNTGEPWDQPGCRFEWIEREHEPEPWHEPDHQPQEKTGCYLGVFSWPLDSEAEAATWITEVWFRVHHAICDGVGACNVINDWLMIYANLINGKLPENGLHRLEPALLKARNRLGLTSWRYLQHLWKQPIALFGATKFIFRKTKPLLPLRRDLPVTEKIYPAIVGQWLKSDQLANIEALAATNEVMTNSVLLGLWFQALDDWRSQQTDSRSNDWMRIILPMSIRQVSDRRLPAANRATIVQIDRRPSDFAELPKFLKGIDREIKIIRGWQLDKIFLIAIRMLSLSTRRLIESAKREKSRGMALFTNLGDPFRRSHRHFGRLNSESSLPFEIDLAGPIKNGIPVNLTVAVFGKRLRLSLHYDQGQISKENAESILAIYIKKLNLAL